MLLFDVLRNSNIESELRKDPYGNLTVDFLQKMEELATCSRHWKKAVDKEHTKFQVTFIAFVTKAALPFVLLLHFVVLFDNATLQNSKDNVIVE